MNDFESRARAAGHAARDAVEDIPAVTTLRPRSSRGPIRAVAIAAAVVIVAVAGTAITVSQRADGPSSDVTKFCSEIDAHSLDASDWVNSRSATTPSVEYLLHAPPEIRDVAKRIFDSRMAGHRERPASAQTLLNWYQLHCFPQAAQERAPADQARFAPPNSSTFAACDASNRVPAIDRYNAAHPTNDHITILGNANTSDPYGKPMIGLATSSNGGFRDDATVRAAPTVDHPEAEISDITGPFGARIAAGLVVSWREGRHTIGVFGRGYGPDQESALIALANQVLVDGNGRPQLAPTDRPSGFSVVYDGPLDELSTLTVDPQFTFAVTAERGAVRLTAAVRDAAGSEAVRFLGTGLLPITVDGRRMLAGSLIASATQNSTGGFAMVRWPVGDGVSLTLTSIQSPGRPAPTLPQLEALAAATRKLDRSEWETLIIQSKGCFGDLVTSRSASGAGSAPPPQSGPSATATTFATPTTSVP